MKILNIISLSVIIFGFSSVMHSLTPDSNPALHTLLMGSIQFPKAVTTIPTIRIYFAGHTIAGEISHNSKTISFSIPEDKTCSEFNMLITQKFEKVVDTKSFAPSNTIKYLKQSLSQPYKLYKITKSNCSIKKNNSDLIQAEPAWIINEQLFDAKNSRIPDNTIIIRCDPSWIDRLEGGDTINLPRIILKSDLLALAESEEKLHEKVTELLLSSLEDDTIHSRITKTVNNNFHLKTIVANVI